MGRMKILPPGIDLDPVFEQDSQVEEMHVAFEYMNLETGNPLDFDEPVSSLGLGK